MDIKFSLKDTGVALSPKDLDSITNDVMAAVRAALQKRLGIAPGAEAAIADVEWLEAGGYVKFSKSA